MYRVILRYDKVVIDAQEESVDQDSDDEVVAAPSDA